MISIIIIYINFNVTSLSTRILYTPKYMYIPIVVIVRILGMTYII